MDPLNFTKSIIHVEMWKNETFYSLLNLKNTIAQRLLDIRMHDWGVSIAYKSI